ncbi:histone-lysine N-methyltransferase ATXR5-like isoform X1 [Miscanthus floridulus]|uniref:histone-lysine N-methyltransferase ATXR5-like isoform X1 n=1 Tax=Miscanthus floridulus TaxID=154761 RepID=UPI00345AD367
MDHRAESSTRSPQLERKRTAAPTCVAPPPILCDTCGSGDDELLRDRCDRGRHTLCLRPVAAVCPIGPCLSHLRPAHQDPQEANRFPMKQVKIVDFFRIQKDAQLAAKCRLSQGSDARR